MFVCACLLSCVQRVRGQVKHHLFKMHEVTLKTDDLPVKVGEVKLRIRDPIGAAVCLLLDTLCSGATELDPLCY